MVAISICSLLVSSSFLVATIQQAAAAPSPPSLDGSAAAFCSHSTNSCAGPITTSHPSDVIIVFTLEALDLQTSCTFSVSDSAGLSWTLRASASSRNDGSTSGNRDQIAEFWAKSPNPLSSDTITESISGCAGSYGGEYNGFQAFAITSANYNSPFDPSNSAPATSSNNYGTSISIPISTSNPNDMIIGGLQISGWSSTTLSPGQGFTGIFDKTEYELQSSTVTNLAVTFGDTNTSQQYWSMIADAIQGAPNTTATFSGHVYVAGTSQPIYGASITIGGTTKTTDTSGSYSISVPSGGTYTATANALGYCQTSTALTISSGTTQTYNPGLPIWDTFAYEPNGYVCSSLNGGNPGWYNLRNDYGSVSSNAHLLYYRSTSSDSISVVSTSSGESGAPTSTPSGATQMVRMSGVDNSPSGNGYAYAYFYLTNVNIPLSSPMYLAFNVYSWTTPGYNGKVSVDAHFTDGTNLRDIQDSLGRYIVDNAGHRIHPAGEYLNSYPTQNMGTYVTYQGSGWRRAVADLSEVRGKTIDYLMVAYDNGQTGSGSPNNFQVYFDDIRLIMATYPNDVVGGGFENGFYGWGISGPAGHAPRASNGPCSGNTADTTVCRSYEGSQSVLIGPQKYTGSSPGDAYLTSVLRIPNRQNFQAPRLAFAYAVATFQTCGCTANDWVRVTLRDRTTLRDVTVLNTVGTNVQGAFSDGVGWSTLSYDLTPLEGHIVWLIINVHNDASGLNTWAWFDGVRVVPGGMTVTETSASSATVKLDPSIYRPSGPGSWPLIGSFAQYATFSFQSPCCGTPVTTGTAGIQVGLDLKAFTQNANSNPPPPDALILGVSTNAWASGGELIASNGDRFGPYYIHDLTTSISVSSMSTASDPNFSLGSFTSFGYNLDPNTSTPSDHIDGAFTAAGGVLIAASALLWDVPGINAVTFVAGTALYVAQLLYDSHKSGTTSTGTNFSTSWTWPAAPCTNPSPPFCPPPPYDNNPLAGGSVAGQVYLGGVTGGGEYRIHIDVSGYVYQDQCPSSSWPTCYQPSISPISTSYDLTIWTMNDQPPVASFTASPSLNTYPNNSVKFDASKSYDPDGSIVSYSWSFGDGSTATGVAVSHSWTTSYVGSNTVTLTVVDNAGLSASQSQTVVVQHCC